MAAEGGSAGAHLIRDGLPALIERIGTDDFTAQLLSLVEDALGARHLSVFRFDTRLVPEVVLAYGVDGGALARRAGQQFIQLRLYRQDPLRTIVRQGRADRYPVFQISSLSAPDVPPERRRFYEALGLTDRITVINRGVAGWVSLNFYRTLQSGMLQHAAVDSLVEHAPSVHAAVSRHVDLIVRSAEPADMTELLGHRLRLLSAGLTPRETEVCVLALQGATNGEIAHHLKIEQSTVSTLRHRAYERLGVSNIVELFLRCLAA